MIVEILNVGVKNKGAELMLHAIMQKMRERYPDVIFTCTPTKKNGHFPAKEIMKLGIRPKLQARGALGLLLRVLSYLPQSFISYFGRVRDQDVDLVLDASGFSYGDQWGVSASRQLARASRRWKKNGTKIVLLPQAFGPFENSAMHASVREWSRNADLIFCREKTSLAYLKNVVGDCDNMKVAGDFTNLVKGKVPLHFKVTEKMVALIPNNQMIKKTEGEDGALYIPFLAKCVEQLRVMGRKPFILVHQTASDGPLAEKIADSVGGIPIIEEASPIGLKGILGECEAVIGSRFHGLVSALSQGVPSLASGWSHKYISLFDDYGVPEGVIDVNINTESLERKIRDLVDPDCQRSLRVQLADRAAFLKNESDHMWGLVFEIIAQPK